MSLHVESILICANYFTSMFACTYCFFHLFLMIYSSNYTSYCTRTSNSGTESNSNKLKVSYDTKLLALIVRHQDNPLLFEGIRQLLLVTLDTQM